ncbi:MAG: hypothetical protein A2Y56_14155 [Candidatus Aminicenantes bacterium RBG_13_63_10]|nr:MAG: hypothetical protein A2Y56_14155 [Candidatus Aminicenantes bacterium RBG_13_63_10]
MRYARWASAAVLVMVSASLFALTFKDLQMNFARVEAAYLEKETALRELFREKGVAFPPRRIYIRVFKRERTVEVWASAERRGPLTLVVSYDFLILSGRLGPKRRLGDGQVPEGFYHISHFNPESRFHLSLGINYPNVSDRILKDGDDPGGAIYIHGSFVTIGCVPITDDKIKELYILAVEAADRGQARIPVHIFPARLDETGWAALREEYQDNRALIEFWEILKPGYDLFEQGRVVPAVSVSGTGRYVVTSSTERRGTHP